MKSLKEAKRILTGGKNYSFEYNEDGNPTILIIENYHDGDRICLDLSRINQDILDELQVDENDID